MLARFIRDYEKLDPDYWEMRNFGLMPWQYRWDCPEWRYDRASYVPVARATGYQPPGLRPAQPSLTSLILVPFGTAHLDKYCSGTISSVYSKVRLSLQ